MTNNIISGNTHLLGLAKDAIKNVEKVVVLK
jgi:hypothetical protein